MALTKIPSSLLDTSSGFDLQGNITLGDSEKIRLGDGPDLDIYHDGSNSYIEDLGDGVLFVKASGGIYFNGKTTDEPLARFIENGAVNLYYDNDLRIATSSAGATVDGTLTVTGNLDITGDINSYNVTDLDVTDQTITLGAGQTEANSGGSGIIIDGSNASILWDETNTEFDINNSINVTGGLNLSGDIYGTGHFDIRSTGNIFNTYGNSSNVYFRTQNGTDRVIIDSSGKVGIGENNPSYQLDILAPTNYRSILIGQAEATGTKRMAIAARHYDSSEQPHNLIGIFTDASNNSILQIGGGFGSTGNFNSVTDIELHTGTGTGTQTTSAMKIDSSGNVGIGTSSPSTPLHVYSNTSGVIATISGPNNYNSETGISLAVDRAKISGVLNGSGGSPGASLRFYTQPDSGSLTERMRINSSGTLLVGTIDGSGAGLEISKIHGVRSTVTNNVAALFDRLSSDGDIALFRKDGTTVGSIGANSSDIYIASTGTYSCGLMFEGSSGASDIRPCNSSGALVDDQIDLGDSTARFHDLYLSGSVTTGAGTEASPAIKVGDNDTGIWHPADNILAFSTWGSERMRIEPNGIVLVGTTSRAVGIIGDVNGFAVSADGGPNNPVVAFADSDATVNVNSVIQEISFQNDTAFTAFYTKFTDRDGVQGTISGSGTGSVSFNTTSDERLKENIVNTTNKLDKIKQIQVKDFNYIGKDVTTTGLIAQELNEIIPDVVREGSEDAAKDPWAVDYGKLTPYLVKAIQEQQTIIDDLKARIETLEE